MKTLYIVYHEDLETQVRSVLHNGMIVPRYTRIDDVIGAHMVEVEEQTGYMADRRNRMIIVIADERVVKELVASLKTLQKKEGHGIRGFVIDTEMVF